MDISVNMFCFFVGVNLSDAHLENQHTEITFSSNCLVGVLNALFSFHLCLQRSQNFLVVDRDSAKGLRSSLSLSKKVQSWVRKFIPKPCFWHIPRGPFLIPFLPKLGSKMEPPFGSLAIKTYRGGEGRGGPKWIPLLPEKRPRFWTPGKWTKFRNYGIEIPFCSESLKL